MGRVIKISAFWIVLTLLASSATPQGSRTSSESHGGDASRVEHKNRAPVSKELLEVRIPRAREFTLSNGLTVLVIEDHRLPLVSIQYSIGAAGPVFEPADLPGLANITAQMMEEGTKSKTSLQIAEAVESLGASLSVSSGYGSYLLSVSASGLADNFDAWFALANDVLLNPSFPKDELDQLKERLRIGLRQQRTDPDFLATERFNRVVYGPHPAANVTTTLAVIDALTPERLAQWHNERLAPQNAILGIAGDVHVDSLLPRLEAALANWKRTALKELPPADPKPAVHRGVYVVDRPGSAQTNLYMGNIAVDRRSPDYFPVLVANQAFGGNGSARLFTKLREEKGYTYGAYSWFIARKYPGPWLAAGNSRTDVTGPAMAEFINEIQRLRAEPVTDRELEDAKRAIVASFALSLESKDELLGYAITQKIYDLPADYWDTYPQKVSAVSAADVRRVAQQYLDPDTLQVVAVGAASAIIPAMRKYGPVEIYNVEGKKISR
ncbi:MAG TPA: pitrilysin family protein [Terriglobia bacterium]|nr:pitrilysin family protein [Terriglobia bacterium]